MRVFWLFGCMIFNTSTNEHTRAALASQSAVMFNQLDQSEGQHRVECEGLVRGQHISLDDAMAPDPAHRLDMDFEHMAW